MPPGTPQDPPKTPPGPPGDPLGSPCEFQCRYQFNKKLQLYAFTYISHCFYQFSIAILPLQIGPCQLLHIFPIDFNNFTICIHLTDSPRDPPRTSQGPSGPPQGPPQTPMDPPRAPPGLPRTPEAPPRTPNERLDLGSFVCATINKDGWI